MKNLKELFKSLIEEGIEANWIKTQIEINLNNGKSYIFKQVEFKELNGDLLYIEEQLQGRVQDYYFIIDNITHIRKIY